MAKGQNIGRAEMEILHYVHDHQPVTVRQVADYFAETKGHVRTTLLNVMERLRKKGYLKRRKLKGVFHYLPSKPKAEMLRTLVGEFIDKALGGSWTPFLAYMAQDAKLSEQDLRELKQIVRELDQQERSNDDEFPA
jgi:predicted transcriptional regulator